MKPGWVVVGTIIGFAVLAGLGLWWLHTETPPPPPLTVQSAPPRPSAPAPDSGQPVTSHPQPRPNTPPPAQALAPNSPSSPPKLNRPDEPAVAPKMAPLRPDWEVDKLHFAHGARTPMEALRPLVSECFRDEARRLKAGDEVVLHFRVAEDGRFQDGGISSSTVQDPYLSACLQDALHDAATAGGAEGPTELSFQLLPDGGVEAGRAPLH